MKTIISIFFIVFTLSSCNSEPPPKFHDGDKVIWISYLDGERVPLTIISERYEEHFGQGETSYWYKVIDDRGVKTEFDEHFLIPVYEKVEHPYYPGEVWTQESLNYNLKILHKLK